MFEVDNRVKVVEIVHPWPNDGSMGHYIGRTGTVSGSNRDGAIVEFDGGGRLFFWNKELELCSK